MARVVDAELAAEIQAMVEKFFGKKLDDALTAGNDKEAAAIVASAESVGSATGAKVVTKAKAAHPQQIEQVQKYQLASQKEKEGFQALAEGDLGTARAAFHAAKNAYPTYHNVAEISGLLADKAAVDPEARRQVTQTVIRKYGWGAPAGAIEQLKQQAAAGSTP